MKTTIIALALCCSVQAHAAIPKDVELNMFCAGYSQGMLEVTTPDTRDYAETESQVQYFYTELDKLRVVHKIDDGYDEKEGKDTPALNHIWAGGYSKFMGTKKFILPEKCLTPYLNYVRTME